MLPRCLVLMAIALCAGCSAVPKYMREVEPPRQLKAPVDRALVVFVRPSAESKSIPAHVMDHNASFLGTAVAGGHFSVLRPPGRQHFIVWADTEDILIADLASGFIYFVEVNPVTDAARFTLKASRRGSSIFPFKPAWVADTVQYYVHPDGAKEEMAEPEQLLERRVRLKDANERLKRFAAAEVAERTLAQTDGHAEVGVPGNVRVATPVPGSRPAPVVVPPPPALPPAAVVAAPVPAAGPPPGPVGFIPEDFPPPPPPGPPPELAHEPEETLRRGYVKGSLLRVTLKVGTTWLGELMAETKNDLKLKIGTGTLQLDFADIESIDELGPAK